MGDPISYRLADSAPIIAEGASTASFNAPISFFISSIAQRFAQFLAYQEFL
jgi:hypothetical protein